MAILILFAFILVPVIEIAVFIEIGGWIGLWPTIGIILATAFIGTGLLRAQGLATLARVRLQLESGELPAEAMFDGLCLLVAGALLLTPGFVTDALGLLLFVPPFRAVLRNWAWRWLERSGRVTVHAAHGRGRGDGGDRPGGTTIEGDYRELPPDERDKPRQ